MDTKTECNSYIYSSYPSHILPSWSRLQRTNFYLVGDGGGAYTSIYVFMGIKKPINVAIFTIQRNISSYAGS